MESAIYVICFRNMNLFGAKCLELEEERNFIQGCLLGSHDFGPSGDDEDKDNSNGSRVQTIEYVDILEVESIEFDEKNKIKGGMRNSDGVSGSGTDILFYP